MSKIIDLSNRRSDQIDGDILDNLYDRVREIASEMIDAGAESCLVIAMTPNGGRAGSFRSKSLKGDMMIIGGCNVFLGEIASDD